ncbi:translation initiation factor IF-2 [Acetitomaculum ruminis DSM 5522]|uniref:Translation initiation factor IF-2 n=1 Tax=Acetitomaculum ruminis DSM 5522 TaxID=1120918 RepID=A0A1I0XRG6_9FIRM|nr:translation initiation factor IF-2 [Acetitomaculum ruminis]SFB03625.1 translation initiation factor IF-2 [Acetitomaculum ruminis DSM 5522]
MAKIRVYGLAKELNIKSKEIIDFFKKEDGQELKAQSGLDDNQVSKFKKFIDKINANVHRQDKDKAVKKEGPVTENKDNNLNNNENKGKKGKKPNISQVFHPQNSQKNSNNNGGNNKNNNKNKNISQNNNQNNADSSNDSHRQNNNGGENRKDNVRDNNKNNNNNKNFNNKNSNNKNKNKNRNNNQNDNNNNRFEKKNKKGHNKNQNQAQQHPVEAKEPEVETIKTIVLEDTMTLKELADKLKIQASVLVKKLFLQGKMVTVNQQIDFDTAENIALEYNVLCEHAVKVDPIEELLKEEEEDTSKMVKRAPVVCVMGHVDHGKTSLLDAIRNTNVTDREAGGITQKIGAYVVTCNGEKLTFLDTPGHEAFTAMRMRGAKSTDIAILVVAADDGVMPQTIEAINHAKAAGIEIIVAVNKIDKPTANIERVKQELSEYELVPEDWGGSTIFVPVSAHTHEGISELLEMVLLTAEVLELKANPKRRARGLILEAELDKGKGPVANILVQKGTLRIGDPIAVGSCHGKIRGMTDDKGRKVKEAGPSTPVAITGLSDVPNAGETFVITKNEKEARSFAETFIAERKEKLIEETKSKMSLDDLFSQIQAGTLKELDIIVKADVQGSVEAIKSSLLKLSNEEVVVKVIHGGVGAINESDVILASASKAIIIGFNVRPDAQAKETADREGVDLRLYKVIYNAIEDIEAAMKGMLDPIYEEKVIGHVQIRQVFKASGIGNIAGSYVLDGSVQRGCKVRINRGEEQIFEGDLESLKRFKDDVKEVKAGYECGLVFSGFNDIRVDDEVEAYIMVEVPR